MTINAEKADALAALLTEYSVLKDMQSRLHKGKQQFSLSATDEEDEHDFLSTDISQAVAHIALDRQLAHVVARLKNLGVEVEA